MSLVNPFLACLIFDPRGPLGSWSNYAITPFSLDGEMWRSVEHFYQAAKFDDWSVREAIKAAHSASRAKKIAWQSAPNAPPDWHQRGPAILRKALRAKFSQSPEQSASLTGTWPAPIFEDSPTDSFWGIGSDGNGQNEFGHLLELVRDELKGVITPVSTSKFLARPAFDQESRFDVVDGVLYHDIHMYARDLLDRKNPLLSNDIQFMSNKVGSSGAILARTNFNRILSAFERKYKDYNWSDDARSLVPRWVDDAVYFLSANSEVKTTATLVLGAGVGQEVEHLWSKFDNPRIVLADVTKRLCDNIRRADPTKGCVKASAENLRGVADSSIDTYVALRVFQSYGLDKVSAASECKRILTRAGVAVISIANAYKDGNGNLLRGLINGSGEIDAVLHLHEAGAVVEAMTAFGFSLEKIEDWESELALLFRLNPMDNNTGRAVF